MRILNVSAAVLAMSAGAALAAPSMETVDTNHDGFASKAEMAAAYPGLTDGDFVNIDANADDRIAPDELYAESAQAILKEYEPGGTPVPEVTMFDSNHDGFASFEEIQTVFPSFEKSDFLDIDLNGDDRISQAEFNDPKATQPMKKYL